MMSKVRTVVNEIEFENEVAEKVSWLQQMKDTMTGFQENEPMYSDIYQISKQ